VTPAPLSAKCPLPPRQRFKRPERVRPPRSSRAHASDGSRNLSQCQGTTNRSNPVNHLTPPSGRHKDELANEAVEQIAPRVVLHRLVAITVRAMSEHTASLRYYGLCHT
jgi:hypothetical protein